MARDFSHARRVIVKIGSAVLAPGGNLEPRVVRALAADMANVAAIGDRSFGRQVVVVTSGAVASGFRSLGFEKSPKNIVGKQAAAAVGQPRLMAAWAEAFASTRFGGDVAQVLLTAEDIDHRTRFLNARRTIETLLESGVVPIVNENDSVSFAEIKLGDNDRLSSLVASLVSADVLVILSSVNGVWAGSGSKKIVPEIRSLDEGLALVRTGKSDVGTGGMSTKITAACAAAAQGIDVVIAGGDERDVVERVLHGEPIGTWFPAARVRAKGVQAGGARKRWLGFSARPRGTLIVDAGAEKAMLTRGASLLPSGLVEVVGDFAQGALVDLAGPGRTVFARGLSSYSGDELRKISGRKTSQIAGVLGYHYADEAVHRDDLALVGPGSGVKESA